MNTTVFRVEMPYQLTEQRCITVEVWYCGDEGGIAKYLGPVNKIPGSSENPITYQEARELATKRVGV